MLKFKSKLLTYIVNFFLLIWMLPQWFTALYLYVYLYSAYLRYN